MGHVRAVNDQCDYYVAIVHWNSSQRLMNNPQVEVFAWWPVLFVRGLYSDRMITEI